jgi:hypothetical protein
MIEHDPDFDEHGRPVATVAPAVYDEPPTPPQERGEVLRGILEFTTRGRTPSARLLRLETLAMIVSAGGCAQTVGDVARRCRCSSRRARQVFREMRSFLFSPTQRR